MQHQGGARARRPARRDRRTGYGSQMLARQGSATLHPSFENACPAGQPMRIPLVVALVFASVAANAAPGEPVHNHPAPEKLGTVHFTTSCAATVQSQFDRAVALLHSFAYDTAAKEFSAIAARDTGCAMARWGVAMSEFHQLWTPPGTSELQL